MEVIVGEDQLSLAIGKRGQNVRLASKLTGWSLDIKSEMEKKAEVEAEIERLERATQELSYLPGATEPVVAALLEAGFRTMEEVALASLEDLTSIEEIDEDLAIDMHDAAEQILEEWLKQEAEEAAKAAEEAAEASPEDTEDGEEERLPSGDPDTEGSVEEAAEVEDTDGEATEATGEVEDTAGATAEPAEVEDTDGVAAEATGEVEDEATDDSADDVVATGGDGASSEPGEDPERAGAREAATEARDE
jgi:N utilization substance protein A